MADMRSIYNGHTHQVVNVATGSSTINTKGPSQSE
jgi:hypothetical protein